MIGIGRRMYWMPMKYWVATKSRVVAQKVCERGTRSRVGTWLDKGLGGEIR
jgi:hypothetical protein